MKVDTRVALNVTLALSIAVTAVVFGLSCAECAATRGTLFAPVGWIVVALTLGAAHAVWLAVLLVAGRRAAARTTSSSGTTLMLLRLERTAPFRVYAAHAAAHGVFVGVGLMVARFGLDADDARFRDYLVLMPLGALPLALVVVHMMVTAGADRRRSSAAAAALRPVQRSASAEHHHHQERQRHSAAAATEAANYALGHGRWIVR